MSKGDMVHNVYNPFDLSPAPGRTPVPLGRGWTAVVLELILPRRYVAVALFLDG
jgi:hypothetical protein